MQYTQVIFDDTPIAYSIDNDNGGYNDGGDVNVIHLVLIIRVMIMTEI